MVSDSEDTYGFKLVDDNGFECVFQGHKHCIEEVSETLSQLYGGNDDES